MTERAKTFISSAPSWPCASSVSPFARFAGIATRLRIISVCLASLGKLLNHSKRSFYCYFKLKINFWGKKFSCTLQGALKNLPTQRSSESLHDLFPNKVSKMSERKKQSLILLLLFFPSISSDDIVSFFKMLSLSNSAEKMFMALIPFL